jgi:hypothetical protein
MAGKRRQKEIKRAEAERLLRRYDSLMTFLALLALTVAPIVFHMIRQDFVAPSITNTTTADTGTMSDVFTHYKLVIYYALASSLIAIFCVKLLTLDVKDFRLTRVDAAIAALCFLLLVSCVVSEYRSIAFNGFIYMLDGTGAHLCYCVLFFFGFHVFSKSRFKNWLYAPLFVSGLINAALSLLNFTGVSLIDTAVIKVILGVPANAVATNASAFTSTFGNVNYLSGFGGVLFAIFFTRLVFSQSSLRPAQNAAQNASAASRPDIGGIVGRIEPLTAVQNAMSFIMAAAAFLIVITSMSSSGFFTIIVMIPVITAFAALGGVTVRKIALAASSLAVCALIFIPVSAANATVLQETFGMFGTFASAGGKTAAPGAPSAESAAGSDNPAVRAMRDGTAARAAASAVLVASAAGSDNPGVSGGTAIREAASAATGAIGLSGASFLRLSAGAKYSLDFNLPDYYPEAGLSPGTGRLYIWKETLGLIAKRPFFGYGMDTLSYAFPQNELNKVSGLGSYAIYVTKPHNIYVGYAYGAGVTALIAFLVFNVFGAAAFLRWFASRRKAVRAADLLILCAHLGWAAYLVQGFVNDDLISTAPLWWALFGAGAGMAYSVMRKTDFT